MPVRDTLLQSLFLALLALAPVYGHGQELPREYAVKAAFLLNFAKFVEWPPQAFASPKAPLVIGILGNNPFRDDLESTIRGKRVDEHPVIVQELGSPQQASHCHMLFISSSENPRLTEILRNLNGRSVLTVGESDRFTERGGMISFVLEGSKIRFQINKKAASDAGLKISSKLLSLALNPRG